MLAIQLIFLAFLGVGVFLLLRAGQHLPNPQLHRRVVLAAAVVLGLMVIGPPIWEAFAEDWRGALTTLVVMIGLACGIGGYVWMLRRAHKRARSEGDG